MARQLYAWRETPRITTQIAEALGVSRCRKAVLTLEMGELPRMDVTYLVTGSEPQRGPRDLPADVAARLARVPLKIRLYLHPLEEDRDHGND